MWIESEIGKGSSMPSYPLAHRLSPMIHNFIHVAVGPAQPQARHAWNSM